MKNQFLKKIGEVYKRGENIIQYINSNVKSKRNDTKAIMISYDFQSGSYIKIHKQDPNFNHKYAQALEDVITKLRIKYKSILEAGVGEATVLANLVPKLKNKKSKIYGFDLAWSRVRYAMKYVKEKKINKVFLFMGDLFNIPLADDSIDIVYTSHSIEPNGGKEREALLELMRVTRKYLILLEPAYELAKPKAKRRMEEYGYIKGLRSIATSLGLNVVEYRLFDVCFSQLNPTGIMIIKKNPKRKGNILNPLICPATGTPLKLIKKSYFSTKGLLVYPVVDEVPCLLEDNAIVATHYMDDF